MARKKKSSQNIVQLPIGSWRIRYTDEQGRRRTETHTKRPDAELALARAKVEVEERRRGLRSMRPVDVRLRDVWAVWRREVGERKRSAVTDESFWRHHLGPELGDLGVGEIDSAHLTRFQKRQEGRGLTVNTLHHHLTLLTTLLRFAHAKGWLLQPPRIKKPKIIVDEADFRYLKSRDELVRVLAAAEVQSPMVHMMYATSALAGLRLGEVCGLRRGDVDLGKRILNVRKSFDGPTKSGKPRMVPILDDLLPLLDGWLGATASELLFTGTRGQMLRRDTPYFRQDRHLGQVLERAGFPRDYITFHGFRHTFATEPAGERSPADRMEACSSLRRWATRSSRSRLPRYRMDCPPTGCRPSTPFLPSAVRREPPRGSRASPPYRDARGPARERGPPR